MNPREAACELASFLQTCRAWGRPLTASREIVDRLANLRFDRACNPLSAPEDTSSPAFLAPQMNNLEDLRAAALACTRCPHLVRFRKQVVFGTGNPHADLMFVGEAPGAEEDAQGEPFVGPAGQLLTKIIVAMGLRREEVYIANILKCRPDMPPGAPGNRKPTIEEMVQCQPWLERQIELIGPRVLVALGATAVQGLLGIEEPIGRLRGRWQEYRGIPLMPTYHPSYLLRSERLADKRRVWEDMMAVLERLGLPISEKQRGYFKNA